jgi:hypothetical protein
MILTPDVPSIGGSITQRQKEAGILLIFYSKIRTSNEEKIARRQLLLTSKPSPFSAKTLDLLSMFHLPAS